MRLVNSNERNYSTMSDSLQKELLARVAIFQQNFPTVSKAAIARHCGMDEANFSAAVAGRRGLSADSVLRLHRLMNLSKKEVWCLFSKPVLTSQILNLQESTQGRPARMRLDNSGWYPGTGGSGAGVDPNDAIGNGIDNTPDADTTGPIWNQDLIDVLRETRGYHRKAVRAINDYINRAKANAGITTPTGVTQKFSRRG
jgi:plasmid maintenance system antidote protein VapI